MKTNKKAVSQEIDKSFDNPIHARIAALDNLVVAHPALNAALDGLTECISWSQVGSEPRGAVLVGVGGTGKTTICNAIVKRFPRREDVSGDAIVSIVPAFYASVPSPSTIKSLAGNLLESLGAQSPRQGNAISLTARLCILLKQCQTKIILLDEFHHLLAEASVGEARANKVCNWIKSLINQTGVMVCLVGVPACEALVNFDSQMSRRFSYRFRLPELAAGTASVPGHLANFLLAISRKFVERLELKFSVDFSDHWRVLQVWAATSGNPAFITLLLKDAAAVALSVGRKTVLESDLAEAYDRGITMSVAKTAANPFKISKQKLLADVNSFSMM